jgi:hypothetical protein
MSATEDKRAITELIYTYCRAMDRIDRELGYSIWHDDAEADYGAEVYQGSGRGFIDFVCAQHSGTLTHVHMVTNILIELDGERAGSEAYYVSDLRFLQDGQVKQVTTWGRYLDRWSKRGGRWGIDRRMMVRDFAELRDAAVMSVPERGGRDRSDPSYAVLGGAK